MSSRTDEELGGRYRRNPLWAGAGEPAIPGAERSFVCDGLGHPAPASRAPVSPLSGPAVATVLAVIAYKLQVRNLKGTLQGQLVSPRCLSHQLGRFEWLGSGVFWKGFFTWAWVGGDLHAGSAGVAAWSTYSGLPPSVGPLGRVPENKAEVTRCHCQVPLPVDAVRNQPRLKGKGHRPQLSMREMSKNFQLSFIYFYFFLYPMHNLKKLFYWRIVDFQCCVSFRCTAKWLSYIYIYI